MKLILDEHLSPAIARALRDRGHDVTAIGDDTGRKGTSDIGVLQEAVRDGRVLVAEDVADFRPLVARLAQAGDSHPGIIIVSRQALMRAGRTIGPLVQALETELLRHPGEHDLTDQVTWLTPTPDDA